MDIKELIFCLTKLQKAGVEHIFVHSNGQTFDIDEEKLIEAIHSITNDKTCYGVKLHLTPFYGLSQLI